MDSLSNRDAAVWEVALTWSEDNGVFAALRLADMDDHGRQRRSLVTSKRHRSSIGQCWHGAQQHNDERLGFLTRCCTNGVDELAHLWWLVLLGVEVFGDRLLAR